MWWKQNKWKVIVPALVVIVLTAAFWFGGNAPGLQGWQASEEPSPTPTAVTEVPVESKAPAETTVPPETVAPTETAVQTETATPAGTPLASQVPVPVDQVPDSGLEGNQVTPVPIPQVSKAPQPQATADPDAPYTCTLSIECSTILGHMDMLTAGKAEMVPEDGIILPATIVAFYEGESVFNILQRTCKHQKLHMEFENTPMYNSAYIEGIGNLYEFDCGEQSGWMYSVNGWFPNYGVSRYQLKDGDVVEFRYTCDLGKDIGGEAALGG